MKPLVKLTLLATLLSSLFGCASANYETRLPPPDAFNPTFLSYKELPGEKVMVVAVDPTGEWAFAYDDNRATLKEAAINAAIKCDKARDKFQVFAKGRIFAINNDIVYYDEIK